MVCLLHQRILNANKIAKILMVIFYDLVLAVWNAENIVVCITPIQKNV